jgi:hypothetical protein
MYSKLLSRKIRPKHLINGDVKVGKFGKEFIRPENMVPEEYLDLVCQGLRLSKKQEKN